jgi:hypothetical protein
MISIDTGVHLLQATMIGIQADSASVVVVGIVVVVVVARRQRRRQRYFQLSPTKRTGGVALQPLLQASRMIDVGFRRATLQAT